MRFVYVMDPMDRVLPDKDTTFAFQRAAQRRGHIALHAEPRDLFIRGGDVYARVRPLLVSDAPPYAVMRAPEEVRLADVEAVLIRKDPPFDAAYLYATIMLERARGRTVIMNDPRGLREANEKLYAMHFARHMPATLVSAHADLIFEFVEEMGGQAVIKPLWGAGGAAVFLLSRGDRNTKAIIESITQDGRHVAMVQEYLPSVVSGDKRIILLDGEILGAINRVPQAGDLRSNIHVGGRVEPCEVTQTERAMVREMAPKLRADGLVFVGLDVIGERLTEVNVTSPTGIQELSRHVGRDMAEPVIDWIERAASDLRPVIPSMPSP